jgi:hypothetical protein
MIRQRITVLPLVRCYLQAHYEVAPFVVKGGEQGLNPFSAFLRAHLDQRTACRLHTPARMSELTDRLEIALPGRRPTKRPMLPPGAVWAFNRFVQQVFFREMVQDAWLRQQVGGQRVDLSVARFLARYGIDEDMLSLETAIRYYWRLAKRAEVILN